MQNGKQVSCSSFFNILIMFSKDTCKLSFLDLIAMLFYCLSLIIIENELFKYIILISLKSHTTWSDFSLCPLLHFSITFEKYYLICVRNILFCSERLIQLILLPISMPSSSTVYRKITKSAKSVYSQEVYEN